MRDFLQAMEDAAEARLETRRQIERPYDYEFKCVCGEWCVIDEGCTVSPNPYALPVCPKCWEEWRRSQNNA